MIGGGSDARHERRRTLESAYNRRRQPREVNMPYTEHQKVIMLCFQYFQAFIESYGQHVQPMMIARRNRLFQTIAMIAVQRKELPTVAEYFRGRNVSIFPGDIAEFEALEYVSAIQDKVMQLQDRSVKVGILDDEDNNENNSMF